MPLSIGPTKDPATLGTYSPRHTRAIPALFVTGINSGAQLLIAEPAIQRAANPELSARGLEDPGSLEKGRLVTDVLTMTALEQCNPVAKIVPRELHDGALHESQPRAVGRRPEPRPTHPLRNTSRCDAIVTRCD